MAPKPKKKRGNGKHPATDEKLTPLVQATLCAMIANGNHFLTACKAAGIAYRTFCDWREKGEKGMPRYAAFLKAIDQAEAESEMLVLGIIKEHAEGIETVETTVSDGPDGNTTTVKTTKLRDWRAAAFMLERRFHERWSQLRKLAHSGALMQRKEVIVHHDPEEEDDDGRQAGPPHEADEQE